MISNIKQHTIKRIFYIPLICLQGDVRENIKGKIIEELVGKCDKDYGYIIDVIDIKDIKDIIMSRSNTNFVVKPTITIKYVKPEIDDIFTGNVKYIFQRGVFINVMDKFDCLITVDKLTEHGFNFKEDKFVKDDYALETDTKVKVKIIAISFNKNTYNCIVTLEE